MRERGREGGRELLVLRMRNGDIYIPVEEPELKGFFSFSFPPPLPLGGVPARLNTLPVRTLPNYLSKE